MLTFPGSLRRTGQEDGVALVSTIGILGAVTLLVVAVLSSTINVTRQTRRDVSWNAALGAAEAGIQDLLYRLNAQPDYWRRIPDAANPAFASFVPVPGAQNGAYFTYTVDPHVEADGKLTVTSTGVVGATTRTVRSIVGRESFLNYVYFADYGTLDPDLYTTWPPNLYDGDIGYGDRDSPTLNPDGTVVDIYGNLVEDFKFGQEAQDRAREQCTYHRYDTDRPVVAGDRNTTNRFPYYGRHADCNEFSFTQATFEGPFHFNDVIQVRRERSTWRSPWLATTSFGDPNSASVHPPGYRIPNGGGTHATPLFEGTVNNRPSYRKPIDIPPNNRELRDTAALGGYVFTGPTRIILRPDGQLYVRSPGSAGRAIGKDTSGATVTLPASGEREVALPGNGVVYVEDATGCAQARPPLQGSTAYAYVQDYLTHMYPADTARWDVTPYGCSAGAAFVEGELRGRLTIASQSDIVITWDIGYQSARADPAVQGVYTRQPPATDRDLLGLIATGQLRVFKPTWCRYRLQYGGVEREVCLHGANIPFRDGGTRAMSDPVIYAAMLSTDHALNVANGTMGGNRGTLTVVGSLSERFSSYVGTPGYTSGQGGGSQVPNSGPDGWASCVDPLVSGGLNGNVNDCRTFGGFHKAFVYDTRVRYMEPPSFLSPDRVSWSRSSFEERTAPANLPPIPSPSP